MSLNLARTKDGDPAIRIRHLVLAMIPSSSPEYGAYRICNAYPPRDPKDCSRENFSPMGGYIDSEEAFSSYAQELIDHYDAVDQLGRESVEQSIPSPWGPSQTRLRYHEGIECITTEGHGGFLISEELNELVDPGWRSSNGAYEEDQMWAVVAFTFPHLFTSREMTSARKTLKNDFPDIYERLTGETIPPEESESRRRAAFFAQHADDFIVISALRSKDDPSKTLCSAAKGGRGKALHRLPPTTTFVVDSEEYDAGWLPYGFIIDEDRHSRVDVNGGCLISVMEANDG